MDRFKQRCSVLDIILFFWVLWAQVHESKKKKKCFFYRQEPDLGFWVFKIYKKKVIQDFFPNHQILLITQILMSHPYCPLLLVGPLDCIQCLHRVDECKSLLVGQHWFVHVWEPIRGPHSCWRSKNELVSCSSY